MKKRLKHYIFASFLAVLFCLKTTGQESDKYLHNALAEKIYLQLDNEVYANNKTIWFKAILINAATHKPNRSSGVLYVDLIDARDKILSSQLIKIKDGIGNGQIRLNKNFNSGTYLLRAYTQWNKNFENDFVFEKYIKIYSSSSGDAFSEPIQNVKSIENGEETLITANFFPSVIDKAHKSKLKVILTTKEKSDTVFAKKSKGKYILEELISSKSDYLELSFITENDYKYSKKVSLQNDFIDIQFFPESGYLVNGFSSRVGFKAIGIDGKGKKVEGDVLNLKDETIATFKSNPLGMGSFRLENVSSSDHYRVRLKDNEGSNKNYYYLPKAEPKGTTFSVLDNGDNLKINVYTTHPITTSFNLKGVCRGYEYYNSDVRLNKGQAQIIIAKEKFPEGSFLFRYLTIKNHLQNAYFLTNDQVGY